MAQRIESSTHDDMIHDAVLDYYARRLATCSSDKTIKIFDIDNTNNNNTNNNNTTTNNSSNNNNNNNNNPTISPPSHRLLQTLRGHDAAVWCVAWAHPKFGTILASSSYDGRVLIWRSLPSAAGAPGQTSSFQKVSESTLHTASVNLVAWGPHESGCLLACASSDGCVSVLEFRDGMWEHVVLQGAHALGVNSVSWAPAGRAGSLVGGGGVGGGGGGGPGGEGGGLRRFVTGGSDCKVKIWDWNPELKTYTNTTTLSGHEDWVRDVAWSPSVLLKSYIASASQDKTVKIWTADATNATTGATDWKCTTLNFSSVLWRVSWSLSGNVLAVSQADNKVSLWKESLKGPWEQIRIIEE